MVMGSVCKFNHHMPFASCLCDHALAAHQPDYRGRLDRLRALVLLSFITFESCKEQEPRAEDLSLDDLSAPLIHYMT
jgi:hypothetical protein